MVNFRRSGYYHYGGFEDYINCLLPLPLPPHRCRLAPHQLPLAAAICNDAVTALPNGKKAGSAVEGEAYCEKLFQLERTFENLSPEQRRQKRQELAKPILDAFLAWGSTRNASAKSKLGEALTYLHNNGRELSEYLNDGRLG